MEPLLSDDLILEKSKVWSEAMKEFCEKETFKEIDFNDIETESEDHSDDDAPDETIINNNNKTAPEPSGENENKCRAMVRVNNFEGDTSSDDFEECANQSLALMKEHRERWEKFGMMKVLETFDWDQISKVVAPWVEQNKLDKTQLSTSVDEHIVHIEEHHHRQVHLSSDDDSLHSLDTANYIRSSRKKKHTSCTTTTIKKFSYVKGSKRHLQKKYGFDLDKDLDKIFCQKYPENAEAIANRGLKAIAEAGPLLGPGLERKRKSFNFTPPMRQKAIEYQPMSLPVKRRKCRQMKRRSDVSKRSVSSSSSSSGSPIRPLKPKFKRLSKAKSKDGSEMEAVPPQAHKESEKGKLTFLNCLKQEPEFEIDLTKLETSDSNSPKSTEKSFKPIPKEQPELLTASSCQGATSSNETGFLGASIINSTAVSSNIQPSVPVPMRKCQLTPIKNKPEPQVQAQPSKKQVKVRLARGKTKQVPEVVVPPEPEKAPIPVDTTKILLFSPTDLEPHRKNLSGKRFYLTQDYFVEKVGKKNSRRFIKLNSKKFPFVFDCSSRISFKLHQESEGSASSDEDILYIFGREGKLLVETEEQKNDNKKE